MEPNSPNENNNILAIHNSANSTPTRSDSERRSFQGDHHRHRFMTYSADPSPVSQSQSNQNRRNHKQSNSPRIQQTNNNNLLSAQQHLNAPTNAHYSPHYGSSAQRAPTNGKRKPAPPLSPQEPQHQQHQTNGDSSPILRELTPQSSSPHSNNNFPRSAEPSPSRSHSSNGRWSKSRSPSPSPRSVGLAKKIGSVLSAPFKSSSRRGSDASEVGPMLHDTHRIGANSFPGTIAMPLLQPSSEYLPSMPTAGATQATHRPPPLTLAQQLIHETRSRDVMSIVPESPERVLRVVNGLASTSTRASNHSRADVTHAFSASSLHDTEMVDSTKATSRMSLESSTAYCSKCRDLENRLALEVDRSRALERALEDQTHKLEQLRNWSTAKITTLDHALKSQEKMLQDVERRMQESHQPDIKSDYLIALQKDFVELNARLAALEGKPSDDSDDSPAQGGFPPPGITRGARSSSFNEARDDFSPSTQPTSFGRITPSTSMSPVLEEEGGHFANLSELVRGSSRERETTRAYSTPPLMVSTGRGSRAQTPQMTTPRKWNPSSPANLASKLVPPTHGGEASPKTPGSNPNSRSAPATPTSRSPRPRYTSALGAKGASPLSFNRDANSPKIHPSRTTTTTTGTVGDTNKTHRPPLETIHNNNNNNTFASSVKPLRTDRSHLVSTSSKRLSQFIPQPNPSHTPTQPLNLVPRKINKPAVGDLIKMFDSSSK